MDSSILPKQFNQFVYNGTPLGQFKRMTHNLIDNGSLIIVEFLQIPTDRPDSKEETGTATHLPPNQPTLLADSFDERLEWEVEGYVDEYVQNSNEADEWEPVVQRIKKAVCKDCIKQSKKFTLEPQIRNQHRTLSCDSAVFE